MIVGVPTETFPGERRVATIPAVVPALTKAGLEVLLEPGAGVSAGFLDVSYTDRGARIAADRAQVFGDADVILQVRALGANPVAGRADLDLLRAGQTVIGFSEPLGAPQAARDLAARGVRAFSMELIPRITRAQSMDALSSMATIAGYKAVLLAAEALPRMFPMLMTAAGTITPARVFIVGAGVAGLQAIASGRRLGAKVEAYDVRPAVKEQVESLGAAFVDLALDTNEAEDTGGYAKAQDEAFLARQREMMARVVARSDVVITTALIPGRPAPVLVTDEMVAGMTPGAVVVDLAAERGGHGGNVEPSRPDETVVAHGVTVLGPTNLPATVPFHASQMYAKNVSTFLLHLIDNGALQVDLEDDITQGTLVSRDGDVVHPRVRELLAGSGLRADMDTFLPLLTIFMLAVFVGVEIITKVPPLLHTPLMSGSNAISGITIIGALLSVAAEGRMSTMLGLLALVLATINVVGGFLVTHRMLAMFKKRQ